MRDKLAEQNFHENIKKAFKPVTDTIKNTSENLTKFITEPFIKNNKTLENFNKKLLELMNDRGILASYLMSPLSKITNPENTTQFRLVKDSSSNRVNDLLIKDTIPIALHDNLLTCRDTGKVFELKGDLLKMITNKNYNVDLASLVEKKIMFDIAEEIRFDLRGIGNKSTRDRTLIKLLKSPAILAAAISNVIFLSSDSDEFSNRVNLLLQEKHAGNLLLQEKHAGKLLLQKKHAGNKSDLINTKNFAILDKTLENKSFSKKQHKQISIKCNVIHE